MESEEIRVMYQTFWQYLKDNHEPQCMLKDIDATMAVQIAVAQEMVKKRWEKLDKFD